METVLERIKKNKNLIICEVAIDHNDAFENEIEYLLNDFSVIGLTNFKNLNEIINSIDPRAEVSLAVGFKAYCQRIKAGIIDCINNNKSVSTMLPLKENDMTYSFMAVVSKNKNRLSFVFLYLINNSSSMDVDNMVAHTFKDNLTGLFNRYTLKRHIGGHKKNGYLCLFDLNKFKEINDTFGHQVGDMVLILIAKYLVDSSTNNEIYYRISGDEFVILFLTDNLEYVKKTIIGINNYMEGLKEGALIQYNGIECSASFGLLELRYNNEVSDISHDTQLKLVDLAMYQAKKSHKTIHLITDEDAHEILKQGDLDERLATLSKNRS